MKIPLIAAVALFTGNALAAPPSLEVTEQFDAHGVTLINESITHDMQLVLVGPNGARHEELFTGRDAVYLDAVGEGMPDGLYRYELRPVAKTKRVKGEVPDNLRGLTQQPESVSPVTGSFRVADGLLIDTSVSEYDSRRKEGADR